MIKIYIPENSDAYDPTSGEFTTIKGGIFRLRTPLSQSPNGKHVTRKGGLMNKLIRRMMNYLTTINACA